MKEQDVYSELSSIRNLMERSTKFISLSGLTGVVAGIYALIGAAVAFRLVYEDTSLSFRAVDDVYTLIAELLVIAGAVLLFSLLSCYWLTFRKARKRGEQVWNPVSRRLVGAMFVPLAAGGAFMLVLIYMGNTFIVAPTCLIFYGLALISGSNYTFSDIKWLGFCEIALGLICAVYPEYGLFFWAFGFGVLHILYGAVMHFKYDR